MNKDTFHTGLHKWKCHWLQWCWVPYLLPNSKNVTHFTLFQLHVYQNHWFVRKHIGMGLYNPTIWCNPTVTPKCSLFLHGLKVTMGPFNPQSKLPSSSDFPGMKLLLWKSTWLCKSCTNFTCPKLIFFYSIHPLCQQWHLPESLSGWKMARLNVIFLPGVFCGTIGAVSLTAKYQLKNHGTSLNKMANMGKRPFPHLV